MIISLSINDLAKYISRQLNTIFPDGRAFDIRNPVDYISGTLDRFSFNMKYHKIFCRSDTGEPFFNHLHSNQYAMFLWTLSNEIFKRNGDLRIADKLFYLNKSLHGIECIYDLDLPEIFYFSHTVGTVLGKASYSNFFVVSQGCTVGQNKGKYPELGKFCMLGAGASVIGKCKIGNGVTIGSNTAIFQRDIPDNTVGFSRDGVITLRKEHSPVAHDFFRYLDN